MMQKIEHVNNVIPNVSNVYKGTVRINVRNVRKREPVICRVLQMHPQQGHANCNVTPCILKILKLIFVLNVRIIVKHVFRMEGKITRFVRNVRIILICMKMNVSFYVRKAFSQKIKYVSVVMVNVRFVQILPHVPNV